MFLLVPAVAALALAAPLSQAADHGDAPTVAGDQAADLGDLFFFMDPNDATNQSVVLGMTFRGFIVPGEAVNFAIFDPAVRYAFQIENTGDAKPDLEISVMFTPRVSSAEPQNCTITLPGGKFFYAQATNPSLAPKAPAQIITTDPNTGIKFFAGEVDDPFFFDIPAFGRFISSVRAGHPNPAVFNRGRDSFAGYNIMAIAMEVPLSMLQHKGSTVLGASATTSRRTERHTKDGSIKGEGKFRQVDREGIPAVNVALIPFAKKNLYNASTPQDDAKGKFANDIVGTLNLLGTDAAHQAALADVAITHGDYLRLDVTKPNLGPKGGTNPEAGFPNGRRLADDTIDTLLTIIANGNPLGDHVDASDVAPQDQFPFFAPAQQPRDAGVLDDNTRN